jgi:4-carboxymuconolactone decarboxylase
MPEAGTLPASERALVALSAALATRDPQAVRGALQEAHGRVDGRAVEETMLQAHLFIGFPDVLEALTRWRELSRASPPSAAADDVDAWLPRGERVCAEVYGPNYGRLRENVCGLHPDLDHWMVHGGYGRVIGRPGLGLRVRELCIAALLAVWNAPRQLHSHLRGALNAGATAAEVDEAVAIACGHLDAARRADVLELWFSVRRRAARKGAA